MSNQAQQAQQSIPEPEVWYLRNVPLDVKRQAKAEASLRGISESELVTEVFTLYFETRRHDGLRSTTPPTSAIDAEIERRKKTKKA